MIPVRLMTKGMRERKAKEILDNGRDRAQDNPRTKVQLPPGVIGIEGWCAEGGIDTLLAPRTADQQRNISDHIEARREGLPPFVHVNNERWRHLPFIGGWIADHLHGKLIEQVHQSRVDDLSARF